MVSDLAGARIHMCMAADRLQADDEFSKNAREALRIMIQAIDGMDRKGLLTSIVSQLHVNHDSSP